MKPIFKGNVMRNFNPEGIALNMTEDLQRAIQCNDYDSEGKWALVIGASTGYGLAARQVLAARGFNTIGVAFERDQSAGAENVVQFEEQVLDYFPESQHVTFMGDCFTTEMKRRVINFLNSKNARLSELVYSVASGRRINEQTGEVVFSSLGAVGKSVTGLTLDLETETVFETTLEPLTDDQVDNTVFVMGGEDWSDWCYYLSSRDCVEKGAKTYALSYEGTDLNADLYRDGSLGAAKADLSTFQHVIKNYTHFTPEVVIARALVTRASAFIPSFAPYIMALEEVHRELGMLETPLDQMCDMCGTDPITIKDDKGRVRLDNFETSQFVQRSVKVLLGKLTPENFREVVAYDLYRKEILKQNGFR